MCRFLTVGLAPASVAAFEQAVRRTLHLSREVNPGIARLFPATDVLFVVTFGGCSCGLDVVRRTAPVARDPRRKRFERRGYSEARIARLLAEPRPVRAERPQIVAFRAALARFAPIRWCSQTVRGSWLTEPVTADVAVAVFPG